MIHVRLLSFMETERQELLLDLIDVNGVPCTCHGPIAGEPVQVVVGSFLHFSEEDEVVGANGVITGTWGEDVVALHGGGVYPVGLGRNVAEVAQVEGVSFGV